MGRGAPEQQRAGQRRRRAWSLRPVKVEAIFQKRMWPVPEVMSCPGKYELKATDITSWLNALARRMIPSFSQSHTVSQKSGKPPTCSAERAR